MQKLNFEFFFATNARIIAKKFIAVAISRILIVKNLLSDIINC